MNYPSKPWTDGQTAELTPGAIYTYSAATGSWDFTSTTESQERDTTVSELESNVPVYISDVDSDKAAVTPVVTTFEARKADVDSDLPTVADKAARVEVPFMTEATYDATKADAESYITNATTVGDPATNNLSTVYEGAQNLNEQLVVSPTAPSVDNKKIWIDSSNGTLKYWNGSSWVQ